MCRQTEEVGPTVGPHAIDIFRSVVPVQAPTYGYSEKPTNFSRLLRQAMGYGGFILIFNPGSRRGEIVNEGCEKYMNLWKVRNLDRVLFLLPLQKIKLNFQ